MENAVTSHFQVRASLHQLNMTLVLEILAVKIFGELLLGS